MQNLIHPYIEEISYIPIKTPLVPAPQTEPDPVFKTAVNDTEVYLTQPDDYADTVNEPASEEVLAVEDEHNIEFVMDEESETSQPESEPEEPSPVFDNLFDGMYTEVESPEKIKSRYNEPYTTSESDSMFIARPDVVDTKTPNNTGSRAMDITCLLYTSPSPRD